MSDLAAVGRIISAMDIWVVASDLLEAMPFSQRHSLSGRDVLQELFIERSADGDPNVLTSSLFLRFSGPFGLRWSLTTRIADTQAQIEAEVSATHYEKEQYTLIRSIWNSSVGSLDALVGEVALASDAVVKDFITTVQTEPLVNLWQRTSLSALSPLKE